MFSFAHPEVEFPIYPWANAPLHSWIESNPPARQGRRNGDRIPCTGMGEQVSGLIQMIRTSLFVSTGEWLYYGNVGTELAPQIPS